MTDLEKLKTDMDTKRAAALAALAAQTKEQDAARDAYYTARAALDAAYAAHAAARAALDAAAARATRAALEAQEKEQDA